jgi:hypothetical protein
MSGSGGRTRRYSPTATDFRWLLDPVSVDDFFERCFERETLHVGGRDAGYYGTVFSLGGFETLLYQSADALRPNMSCIRTEKDPAGIVATHENGIPTKFVTKSLLATVRAVLDGGYSLVVTGIDRHWLPLARLIREIEALFYNPLATVLFYSPPGVQGAPPHFDPYDNYILQIDGYKDWTIYPPKMVLPLASQLRSVTNESFGEPRSLRLCPGDLLYIPRGVVHEASSGDAASLHVTLYNHAYRWRDLICDIVERLAEQEIAFRRSVPLPVSRQIAAGASAAEAGAVDALAPLFRFCLERFAEVRSVGRHARRMVDRLLPLETGDTAMASWLDPLDASQCIAKRPGMLCYLYDDDDKIVIGFPGGKLATPAGIRPALEFIIRAGAPFELADLPGDMSHRSKEILIRRLVQAGLLFFPATSS